MAEMKKTSDELAVDRTELAAMRTMMAAERSLMAWNRTALSMMGFGFTLYKVLSAFQEAGHLLPRESTPRNAGMILVALGVISMIMGIIEYRASLSSMSEIKHYSFWRPSIIIALIMAAAGILLLITLITRIL